MSDDELGYQNLKTAFTGTSNSQLSGSNIFPMISEDTGTAQTGNDGES